MQFPDFLKLAKVGPLSQFLVTGTVCMTFISCLGALFAFVWFGIDVKPGLKEVLILLLGVLAREFGAVCQHWMGSSFSSQRKTELLTNDPSRPAANREEP